MKHHLHRRADAFKHAFDGLSWAVKTQTNYKIHLIISLIVLAAGMFFHISYYEWLFIIMAITLGLVIEAVNTALEASTDAITREWKSEIKIAKDVAAAAMLTYAVGVTVLACMMFLPKIWYFVQFY